MSKQETDGRLNPDDLLKEIKNQEADEGRGILKIFFGYAAGVGKTYAMLEDAHTAKKQGLDVVVGYIEPHTRPDTMALLEGLEVMPPLEVVYKGISLRDFDLDDALKRKPDLIIVDELAHTNAPGMRHPKRYSDIEELLDAGIDVYTTVNVQHVESLNDVVAATTEVVVQERVPDYIFDKAEQLELIDLEPEELIQRLHEGKIYKEKQAKKALSNFFVEDHLNALREISLRYTADQVNLDVEARKGDNSNRIKEHILVCISPSPTNANVIRTAARMASAFHGKFTALYVETPESKYFNASQKKTLTDNLKLAEKLGAGVSVTYSDDAPYQITEFARIAGITKIVTGRARRRKAIGGISIGKPTFVDRLIQFAPHIEVFVIPDSEARNIHKVGAKTSVHFQAKDFLKMAVFLAASVLIGLCFHRLGLREENIIMIFMLSVLLTANQTSGKLYGLISVGVSVLAFNFFFTDPRFSFETGKEYFVTYIVMLFAAFITSSLTSRARSQALASAINMHRTNILMDANSHLQQAETLDEIVYQSEKQLYRILQKPIVFYTAEAGIISNIYSYASEEENAVDETYIDANEQAVVNWVLKNKKQAGTGTETLPGAKGCYLPITSRNHQVLAVVGIILPDDDVLEEKSRSMLAALLGQICFALERYDMNLKKNESILQAERERFRANLLRSVSHDLRTPLTNISGSASSLLSTEFDVETKTRLTQGIYDDSIWLIDLVENLLSISKLDSDHVELRKEPQLVEELITEALDHVSRNAQNHIITVDVKEPLLMAEVDLTLVIQVLINLINNAIEYTQGGSEILIRAFRRSATVVMEVSDDGQGIPDEYKNSIFELFFTGDGTSGDSRRGMGLGLALCKSIVEVHGGEIRILDNEPSGAKFQFTLPLAEVKTSENFNLNC